MHPLHNVSRGPLVFLRSSTEKTEAEGVYITPLRNERQFSVQPFSAMNKRFLQSEKALTQANIHYSFMLPTHVSLGKMSDLHIF